MEQPPQHLNIADIDGDGKPDIVCGYLAPAAFSVLKNTGVNGNIGFGIYVQYDTPFAAALNSGVVSDIDSDGSPDVALVGNSNSISLYINQSPDFITLCNQGNAVINSSKTGTIYSWQVNTGTGYLNINDNANYVGSTTPVLQLTNIPSSWYGYKYRCLVNSGGYSRETCLKFKNSWLGGTGNWENPANWSCGNIPDLYTDVVIDTGTITLNSNVIVRSLNVSSGVDISIAAGYNILISGGNISTGTLSGSPNSCGPITINGTYTQETALTSGNTVQVQVNVITPGAYAISTNTINGISFYKSGTFTSTGIQNVTLNGIGTPDFAGMSSFNISFANSNCFFSINVIALAPSYVPTILNDNWSYAVTSTPDPTDSLFKQSLPSFQQINGNSFRQFNEINEFQLNHNSGYRRSNNNYYFYYDHFEDTHSLGFLQATGEIKQLDENASVNSTWISDITGWVNGGSQNAPIRVQGTLVQKGVSVSLSTGLNFSNVMKVTLAFFDMINPSSPTYLYSEERWFALGVGLIYYRSSDPFGGGITYQLKRYELF